MSNQLFGVSVSTYSGTERYAVVAENAREAQWRMEELCDPALDMKVMEVRPLIEMIEDEYGDIVILTSDC